MKVCPNCQREYPDEVKFCNTDGSLLISQAVSAAPAQAAFAGAVNAMPDSQAAAAPLNGFPGETPVPQAPPPVAAITQAPPPAPSYADNAPTQQAQAVKRKIPVLPLAALAASLLILLGLGWFAMAAFHGKQDAIKQSPPIAASPASAPVAATASAPASIPAAQAALPAPKEQPASPFSSDPQDPTTVTNFGVPLVTEVVSYGKNSPKVRAERIADRMNDCFLNDLVPPRTVTNMRQGFLRNDATGTKYVFFGYLHQGANHDTADIVATVDSVTAAHCKVAPVVLACWWRDVLRDWLLIDHGQAPQYTVAYTPELKDFYNALPRENGAGTSQSDRFRKAVDTLINNNDEYERLRLLSLTVPPHYVAHPDNYSPALNDDGGPSTSG